MAVDDARNLYSEALEALESVRKQPMPVGILETDSMLASAQIKATEAAALASLATADASYAVRNELQKIAAKMGDK